MEEFLALEVEVKAELLGHTSRKASSATPRSEPRSHAGPESGAGARSVGGDQRHYEPGTTCETESTKRCQFSMLASKLSRPLRVSW